MTEVNNGKIQLKNLLGGVNTNALLYLGTSNDTSAVDVAWTSLPSENLYGGLGRALGSYVSTGSYTWNVTYTYSATSPESCNLYGLYATSGSTLCYAEQQGAGAVKNLGVGDTLKLTAQGTAN
jgi:hypothetical protein